MYKKYCGWMSFSAPVCLKTLANGCFDGFVVNCPIYQGINKCCFHTIQVALVAACSANAVLGGYLGCCKESLFLSTLN